MLWTDAGKGWIGGFKWDLVCLHHVELVTLEQKLEELREPALALWGRAILL